MTDVIVVGGGPAGVSAAIYLKRFKLDVTILMKDYGTLGKTDHIENYYGFVEPITGKELFENGIKQAKRLEIPVLVEEVLGIDYFDHFTVKTNKGEHEAKVVLLATGANRASLKVKGFNDFLGKGISFCAVCDGFIYRNKRIAIVGSGEFMLEELDVLRNFSTDLTLFTNGVPLEHDVEGVQIVSDKIKEIVGNDVITGVVTTTE
ncbi:MAG: FAD-dependent oxidoreductase, partial [Candidatus Izemoplasmatales bacterium]|nr:FAD-dependent oxidoreductase [Candidatus Izemoplasmatales bacterium]